jgi:serine/threonine protein kinase
LRRIKCDSVVSFIDGYLYDGELWILMEFCAGGSLSDLRDITKLTLSELEVRAVMASCIIGLEYLHRHKSIHRDIKAGNILITGDGKAKLADFGVSAQISNSKQGRKTMIGTPFWMAPELIQETYYDGKADIWSLGITILELVEGYPPHFNVHPMRAIFMIPMKPAPQLQNPDKWSIAMADFTEKCLTKKVVDRWDAERLLAHEWISGDVEITRLNKGMEVLRKVVENNMEAIEASRFNQNEVDKDTDNDNDTSSDKTATLVGIDVEQLPESRSSISPAESCRSASFSGSRRSTLNKNSRPCSKRIKRHATNSKSTTGEGPNTSSSSQFMDNTSGTMRKLNQSNDDYAATPPRESFVGGFYTLEGTMKAPVIGKLSSEDVYGTLKLGEGTSTKSSIKTARFGSQIDVTRYELENPSSTYDLVLLLGEGSYGRVYKAFKKEEVGVTEVAVKIIPCDSQSDVNAEIDFLRKLNCPYIVSFVDGFLYDEELWIVMEYCAGGSLSDLKEITNRNLTESELRLVMCYCILGLRHLHNFMSIHRDIKAGNILLTVDGIAKLADFGVSAQNQSATQKRRTVIGTPFWMAPEVIQETSYDSKADIWSLGITALELCEGRPPHFEVHPMRAIFLIPIKPAPTLKEPEKWSPEMASFVSRCLVKDADARGSSDELATHPWFSSVLGEVECGLHPRDLCALVSENLDAVYRARESRRASKHVNLAHRPSMHKHDEEDEEEDADDDDASTVNGEIGDNVSDDTMALGRASRETSISERTATAINDDDTDDDCMGTFRIVKTNKFSDSDQTPLRTQSSMLDSYESTGDDSWLVSRPGSVAIRNSIFKQASTISVNALGAVTEYPLSDESDTDSDATGVMHSNTHDEPDNQSSYDDSRSTTNVFNNPVTRQVPFPLP